MLCSLTIPPFSPFCSACLFANTRTPGLTAQKLFLKYSRKGGRVIPTLDITIVLVALGSCAIFIPIGYFLCFFVTAKKRRSQERDSRRALDEAVAEAARIKKEADLVLKDELLKRKEELEEESQETRHELRQLEKRLSKREDNLERKLELLSKKERYIEGLQTNLTTKLKAVEDKDTHLKKVIEEQEKALLKISGYSREEAERLLLNRLNKELEEECAKRISEATNKIKETANEQAAKIICETIQRSAANHTVENIVSAVELPNEEMKGRIIGREGRNIRAFEKATGIDVIVDDTPGVIVLSGFDSIRREVARLTMEKLIADGRIHPARVEEVAEQTKKEMEETIKEIGKRVCFEMGFHDMHPEIIQLLGRLRYRTSYGQNQLNHAMEVAELCGIIAGELKLDTKLARRCGLLHDIGKATGSDVEGGHASVGAELAKRYEEKPAVINAIAAHHEEVPAETAYAPLVSAADAISASRPGARRESLEKYIKRLEKLEGIANRFDGVRGAYAIQAGREIRVIVDPEDVDDNMAQKICYDIARGIEGELEYPGEVVVTVIRETRSIEHAK
ncbi:MAG: ribonuclease Y [Candidatus Brocadiales bacterium]